MVNSNRKKKFIISEHYDLRADLIVGGACAVSRFLVSMNTIVSINAVSKNPGANKRILALLNYARIFSHSFSSLVERKKRKTGQLDLKFSW